MRIADSGPPGQRLTTTPGAIPISVMPAKAHRCPGRIATIPKRRAHANRSSHPLRRVPSDVGFFTSEKALDARLRGHDELKNVRAPATFPATLV